MAQDSSSEEDSDDEVDLVEGRDGTLVAAKVSVCRYRFPPVTYKILLIQGFVLTHLEKPGLVYINFRY